MAGEVPANKSEIIEMKRRLRAEMQARRAALAQAKPDAGERVAHLADQFPAAKIVSGYIPMRHEIDPTPLLAALADRLGARTALPALVQGDMEFRLWQPGEALAEAAFGTRQPAAEGGVTPDLLLVPLLAFTRAGGRLGYGGGHYDRWLSRHPNAIPVGIAFSGQERPDLPLEPHDFMLGGVVTEAEYIARVEETA